MLWASVRISVLVCTIPNYKNFSERSSEVSVKIVMKYCFPYWNFARKAGDMSTILQVYVPFVVEVGWSVFSVAVPATL